MKLAVNSRYPDEVPLSTMPPQVLAMLPKLPDDLEYRFIGTRLILLRCARPYDRRTTSKMRCPKPY